MRTSDPKYDLYMSPSQAGAILDRAMANRDWAPPGGTSNNRYHAERVPFDAEFVRAFRARVESRPDMWIKVSGEDWPGALMVQMYIGWHDDPRGGYFVAWGLEHQYLLAPEELRSFSYLVYHLEEESEIVRTDEGIGAHWQEPPYARDAALHVDHLMIWMDAHRRTLGHLAKVAT